MSPAQVFRFKPALLRAPQDWALDGDELRGPHGSFDLTTVTETALTEMGWYGSKILRLDLIHPEGKLSVGVTGASSNPNTHAFADLVGAVLDRLAERDADLRLYIGERGPIRIVMFGIGLAAFAFAGVVGISTLAVVGHDTVEVATGIAVMALFGLGVMVHYWPFGSAPKATVGAAPALVAALKGGADKGSSK